MCITSAARHQASKDVSTLAHRYCVISTDDRPLRAVRQEEVYGVGAEQLRVFIHYHPQFYHLHVHFTRAHVNPGCEAERAHLLSDVIQNLEGQDDYYVRRTLTHRLRENDPLLKALRPPE